MTTDESVHLPAPREHRFTPEDFDAEDLDQLKSCIDKLLAMDVDNRRQAERFVSAWLEFDAFVSEAQNSLRVKKARFTDDEDARQRWSYFVEHIKPKMDVWNDDLGRKLCASPALDELRDSEFSPVLRKTESELALFCDENVPLHREIEELSNRYSEITSDWLVEFDGEKYPLSAMRQFLMDSERDTRRRAWEARARTCHEDAEELEQLWQQMFEIRCRIADNAGYDNFRDYVFAEKMRDYEPDSCFAFHELVEQQVLPLARQIDAQRRDALGLETTRPWDIYADPDGREPLEPFEGADELVDGVTNMMVRLDDALGAKFEAVSDHCDLEARPNKQQGGFMMAMHASRRPFVFANVSGLHGDVTCLLHEAGHALHFLAHAHDLCGRRVHIPMEFRELASMAMELFHYQTLDEFYDEPDRQRAIRQHLRGAVRLLLFIAAGDAFQHELYDRPDHTAEDRRRLWIAQQQRFFPHIDRTDILPNWLETEWHRTLHYFMLPFYFIEYGFAQLGALQLAMAAEQDREKTLKDYREALALGARASTEELYEAAGAEFLPTSRKVRETMDWVRGRLCRTNASPPPDLPPVGSSSGP